MDKTHQQQSIEALVQVALLESKEIYVRFAEIIAYLQKQQHRAALGTLAGLSDQLKFVETVLKAASRISQQQDTDGGDERRKHEEKRER